MEILEKVDKKILELTEYIKNNKDRLDEEDYAKLNSVGIEI